MSIDIMCAPAVISEPIPYGVSSIKVMKCEDCL